MADSDTGVRLIRVRCGEKMLVRAYYVFALESTETLADNWQSVIVAAEEKYEQFGAIECESTESRITMVVISEMSPSQISVFQHWLDATMYANHFLDA